METSAITYRNFLKLLAFRKFMNKLMVLCYFEIHFNKHYMFVKTTARFFKKRAASIAKNSTLGYVWATPFPDHRLNIQKKNRLIILPNPSVPNFTEFCLIHKTLSHKLYILMRLFVWVIPFRGHWLSHKPPCQFLHRSVLFPWHMAKILFFYTFLNSL